MLKMTLHRPYRPRPCQVRRHIDENEAVRDRSAFFFTMVHTKALDHVIFTTDNFKIVLWSFCQLNLINKYNPLNALSSIPHSLAFILVKN